MFILKKLMNNMYDYISNFYDGIIFFSKKIFLICLDDMCFFNFLVVLIVISFFFLINFRCL